MSTANNVNNIANNLVNAQLGISKSAEERLETVKEITQATGVYCARPLQDENNTVYENQQRVHRIEAVASLAIADYATHRQCDLYQHINTKDAQTQSFLSSIGYGTSAQSAASNMLSNGFSGTVLGGHGGASYSASSLSASSAELASLMNTGQFTRMVDGIQVVYKVKDMDSADVMKVLRQASTEKANNDRVLNVHGTKNQLAAMNELRGASANSLKLSGIDIGKGRTSDIQKARESLLTELVNAQKSGSSIEINNVQNKLSQLDKHEKMFGGSEHANNNWAANKRMGRRIIASNLVGSDMMTGYRTYKNAATVTAASVRIATRAVDTAVFNVEKLVGKFTNSDRFNAFHNGHQEARDRAKARTQARRNGTQKQYRLSEKERRLKNRQERRSRADARLDSKQTKLRNEGRGATADRRQKRRDKRKDRQGKLAGAKQNVKDRFTGLKEKFGKMTDFIKDNPVMKIIKAPFNLIGSIKEGLKKLVMKYIAIPIGGLLLVTALFTGVIDVLVYAVHFLSEEVKTDLTGALNNINYNQLIVDDVAETLGHGFLEVSKKDAERHFLDVENKDGVGSGAVPSDGLAWYKAPTDGELRYIYDTENQKELGGVNANLLPIMSAMKLRYLDSINYEQWLTARGYAYYLYVATHDILGYDYEDDDDCSKDALYEGTVSWNVETRMLTRPKNELCTNLYVHGYDSNLNKTLNEAKMNTIDGLNMALALLELPISFDNSAHGIFDTMPSDSAGTCNNALPVQAGTREGTDANSADYDNKCGFVEHIHTASCYGLTCTKGDHDCARDGCSGTLSCINCGNAWPCSTQGCARMYSFMKYDCNEEDHTHQSAPPANYTSSTDNNYNDCYTLTCGYSAHAHEDWVDAANPGCWKTKYICLGHCGGHIIPQIDVEIDMSFENIVANDSFKTVYWLGESDFNQDWIVENLKMNSIVEWKEAWNKKMAAWFFPFPSSPSAFIENYAKWAVSNFAQGVDTITGWISGLFGGSSEDDVKKVVQEDSGEDLYSFTGWYDENGVLDKDQIEYLEDLYGTYETEYEDGVKAWEDFDVVFPVGFCRPMTTSQKESVLKQLEALHPNLSESRIKAITQAMDYVGEFWYDLSTRTGTAESTSGRIDCSGFVSSVLRHSLNWSNDWTASGFASAGFEYGGSPNSLQPGDIVAMNRTSSWSGSGGWGNGGTNHVVIYIGFLPDGVKGYPDCASSGHYIIDCSSGMGGSAIRKVDASFFASYPYVYNGCY